jgi:hypothetical protein
LHRRRAAEESEQTESSCALDLHIDKHADEIIAAFEHYDLVCARASHQSRRIRLARPFAKHFQFSADQKFINPAGRSVYDFEQIMITSLFDAFVDLLHDFRRGRIVPGRVTKHERVIELDFSH